MKNRPASPKLPRTANPRLALEPRIVFDAAAGVAVTQDMVDHGQADAAQVTAASAQRDTETARAAAAAPAEKSADKATVAEKGVEASAMAPAAPVEIIFVDSNVKDVQNYLQGRNAEVVILDPNRDGVQQIAETLAGRTNVSAIHILSHGSAGQLTLGTGVLNGYSISNTYVDDFAIIKSALTADADILLYGCDAGDGAAGDQFMAALANATGADITASIDVTGSVALGGNWVLEKQLGHIETSTIVAADWNGRMDAQVTAATGEGAMLVAQGLNIYSVDIASGKAILLTTVPASLGGQTGMTDINSLAVDQTNGLIYFTNNAAANGNRALFAYDYLTANLTEAQRYIVIDTNLTDNAAGSNIAINANNGSGVGGGSATFANGTLYLGVEFNANNNTDSTIYRIAFATGGRAITGITSLATVTSDWGDLGYDRATNTIESVAGGVLKRYDALSGVARTDFNNIAIATQQQAGESQTGKTYLVGTALQQYNPVTGANIGAAVTIFRANDANDGTVNLGAVNDAAGWTPPTATVGDKVFFDNNNNGVFDGTDVGAANVTVQLINDVNNNGVVDTGDAVLATDTTSASGNYLFTGVLPGHYIVRVTDTNNVLGVNATHPYTQAGTSNIRSDADITSIGQNNLAIDFGVRNNAPVANADTFIVKQGYTVIGTVFEQNGIAGDSDADGDTFRLTQINGAAFTVGTPITLAFGTLTVTNAATGFISFAANPNAAGPQTFTYTITDRTGTSTTTTVTVNITNSAPTVNLSGPSSILTNGSFETPVVTNLAADSNTGVQNNIQTTNAYGGWTADATNRINVLKTDGTPYRFGAESGADGVQYIDLSGAGYIQQTFTVANSGSFTFGGEFSNRGSTAEPGYQAPTATIQIISVVGGVETVVGTATITLTKVMGDASWRATSATVNLTAGVNYIYRATIGDNAHFDNAFIYETGGRSTAYVENAAPVAIAAATASISDIDDTNMESATIKLTNPQTGDILSVISALPAGITASAYDPVTGVITLTGTASRANYGLALSRIGFSNTTDTPSTVTRSVTVTVSDGQVTSAAATTSITVTAVNDAPTQVLPTTFTTNEDTGVRLAGLSIADVDAAGGTETITLTVASGTLTAAAAGGVTIVSGNGTNTLVLSGTVANLNAYLAVTANQPLYTPAADFNGTVNLTMVTDDGGNTGTDPGTSGTATSEAATSTSVITVVAVNDAPVNVVPGAQTTAEDTAKAITGVTVSDVDNTALTTTVAVTKGTLSVTTGGGATITNNGTGTVTLSGTAAQINAALAGLTYTNTADYNGADTLTVTTSDGTLSDVDTVAITVTPVADITNDAVTTAEDTPITFNVITGTNGATADSFENAGRTLTSVTQPANGAVTFTPAGAVTFTPNQDFNGTTTFTYTVTSGGVTETATVTMTVTAVNDAPVNVVPGAQTTAEDTAKAITGVTVGDVDGAGTALTTTVAVTKGTLSVTTGGGATITNNGTGTVTLAGTAAQINAALAGLTYTNTADYNGADTLTVTTSDGTLSDVDTVAITVTPVADITNDAVTTAEDTPITFNVITGTNGATADSFENAGRTLTSVTQPANGTVTFTPAGAVTFTPNQDFNGTTTFTYTVTSGGVTETATVTMTVTAVNDAPVNVVPGAQTTAEDTAKAITGVTVGDVDGAGTALTTTVAVTKGTLSVTTGGGATISNNGTGTVTLAGTAAQINAALAGLTYTNTADYNGADTLTVTTSDGTLSDVDTVAITVTPVADITNDSVTTAEDTPITFNVITGTNGATADSFENAGRTLTSVTQPANGTVTFTPAGAVTFTPAANFNGTTSFTYTVTSGGVTETATVTMTVTAVNDAPVTTVPGAQTATEDTALPITGVSVADVDGDNLTTTVTVTNGTATVATFAGATISNNGSGTVTITGTAAAVNGALAALTYTNTADYNGAASIAVSTSDGTLTDSKTISVTVNAVADITNDAVTTAEDTPITFNVITGTNGATADSFENAGRTLTSVTQPANGAVTFTPAGAVTFTPNQDFNGTTTFTYTVTSGGVTETATVTMTVTAVNDAPVNVVPGAQTTAEDTAKAITGVTVGDVDGAGTALTTTVAVTKGTLSVTTGGGATITNNGTGTVTLAGTAAQINAALAGLTYTNTADYNGADTLTVTTSDGTLSDVDTVAITVNPVADITNDAVTTAEDTPITFNVITGTNGATADSFENAGRTLTSVTQPANGTVTFTPAGAVTFTPAANFNGTTSFTYTVTSGGVTETATVTMTVTAVNDAPVTTVPGAQTATEDTALPITGVSVADVDGDNLTTTVTVTNGTATVATFAGATISNNGSGTVTITGTAAAVNGALAGLAYTNTADYNGAASIAVSTSDGTLTDSKTISVTVNAVADITNDAVTTAEDTPITFNVITGTNGATADSFENAGRTLTSVTQPANGAVTFDAAGNIVFTPNANFNGTTSFTYTVTSGGVTETATVTMTITAVNDAPVANPDTGAVQEDATLTVTAANGVILGAGADTDVDNAQNTLVVSGAVAGTGAVTQGSGVNTSLTGSFGHLTLQADGSYVYLADLANRLALNATGSDVFTYTVKDPANGVSNTTTITITVTGTNDAPTAVADTASTTINTPLNNINVLGNDTDPDTGDVLTLTSATIADSTKGSITTNGNGTINFTPAANVTGPVVINYTISDGKGGTSSSTLTVNVGNNTPPDSADKTLTATEDTPLTLGTGTFTFTDADNGQTLNAVRIDSLPAAGTLRLNGVAVTTGQVISVADINAGNLVYTPALNGNGTAYASFNFSVQDSAGGFDTTPNTITVDVTAVNDAPVLSVPATLAYTENQAPTAIDNALVVSDVDSPNLASATVTITNFVAGQDVLGFANQNGITGSFDAATGVLTLTGSATVAQYQQALRSVTYANTSDNPVTTPRSVAFAVNDGALPSNVVTSTVNLSAVNDAPVNTLPVGYTTLEDTGLKLTGLSVADPDAGASNVQLTLSVASGTLAAADGTGVTVTGSGSGSIVLTGTVSAINTYLGATASQPVFTPSANATASVTLTMVTNDLGNTGSGGALSDSDTTTIAITSVNDAPSGTNATLTATEDTARTFTAGDFGFTDPGDTPANTFQSVVITSLPTAGTLTYNGVAVTAGQEILAANLNLLSYKGAQDGNGTAYATFTFQVRDNGGTLNGGADLDPTPNTITFNLTAVNDAPVANADTGAVAEDATLTTPVVNGVIRGGAGADTDVDDASNTLVVNGAIVGTGTVVAGAGVNTSLTGSYGHLTLQADGSYVYVADLANRLGQGAIGTDTFSYNVKDPSGAVSNTTTITITVTGTNDAPTAVNDVASTPINTTLNNINVLGNDTDPDTGDVLTLSSAAVADATKGSVTTNNDGTINFTPAANVTGPVVINYTISDGKGGSSSATLTVNIGANTPPDSANKTLTATEDTPLTLGTGTFNFTDADAGQTLNAVRIDSLPAAGTLRLNGVAVTAGQVISVADINGNKLTYQGAQDGNGTAYASFNFSVQDSGGAFDNAPNTITFNVTAVNDAPVANPDTGAVQEDATLTVTAANGVILGAGADTDVDNAQNTLVVSGAVAGTGAVTQNQGVNTSLAGTYGHLTLQADGSYVYVADTANALAAGATATDTFTYTVRDTGGLFSSTTITITVTGTNDAPVSRPDTGAVQQDATLTVNAANGVILGNGGPGADTDVDNTQASLVVSGAVAGTGAVTQNQGVNTSLAGTYGHLTLQADGSYVYTADTAKALALGVTATDTFTYTVRDPGGLLSSTTITVTVTGTNDNPVANPDAGSTPINVPLNNINVVGNDTDVDGDTLTVSNPMVDPAKGSVTLNPDGTINFTPAANVTGPVAITYTVSDGKGGSATGTLTVTVGANTPPDSIDRTVTTAEDTAITLGNSTFTFIDADAGQTLANVRIDTLPAAGTLLLNGAAVTAGQVISATDISAGKLTYTPGLNGNGGGYASFNFSVQDSGGVYDVVPNTITFNVTPVNDAPVAQNDSVTTNEDTPLTLMPATLLGNDSDVDGDLLTITSVQSPVGGTVAIVNGNVVFTPAQDFNGPASFTYTVSDGKGGTATATVNVSVTPVNDAPVANNDVATTPVNTPLVNFNVLANDTDVDGDTLTLTTATLADPSQGTLTFNPNGTVSFTPANNLSGPVLINYTARDPSGLTSSATLTVNVGANTPPTGADKSLPLNEDTTRALATADFGFADADAGQALANVRIDTVPAAGKGALLLNGVAVTAGQVVSAADIAAGKLVYAPAANGNGNAYANFTFSVQDSAGAFDAAPNTITFDVAPVNDAPVAVNDTVSGTEDTPLTIPFAQLTGNDTDVDTGDVLTITSVTAGTGGTVAIVGGNVVFTPSPNFNGPATFTYTVSDGNGGTATATVTVNVAPVNDAPVAVNDTASTPINVTLANINVLNNDSDVDGDLLTVTNVNVDPTKGTATVNNDNTITFVPATGVSGPTVITYTISDGKGGTATATLTVNVGNNTPPDSADRTLTTNEDTSRTLAVADFTFTDPDAGQTLAAVRIDALPANGSLLLNGVAVTAGQVVSVADINAGRLVFTPAANANGTGYASFDFSVQDSAGAFDTTPNTVTFNVNPVNDNPVASGDTVSTPEDTPLSIPANNLLGNDTDVDGDTLTITSVQNPVGGSVAIVNGNVVFTPAPNFNGPASFTYTVSDGNGGTSTATVVVNVTPVNDAPVAAADTVSGTEDTPLTIAPGTLLGNDSDVDGDPLIIASVQGAVGGNVSLDGNGNVVFVPNANFNGPASFTYTVSDGKGGTSTATVTVNVAPVNDAPVANNDVATTPVNTPLVNFNVLANDTDVDGDTLTLTTATLADPSQGTLTFNPNGTVSFTPANNLSGPVLINYTARDPSGLTSSATLTVNVGANTPPTGADKSLPLNEDTTRALATADFGFADADAGQALANVRIDTVPAAGKGALLLNGVAVTAGQVVSAADIAAGKLVYAPAANGNGNAYANFTFSVQDSAGAFDAAPNTITFDVAPVNDAPVAVNDTVSGTEDTPLTIPFAQLTGNDTDVDTGDVLTITSVTAGTGGTVTISNGNVVFTPSPNFNGPATFTYTVSDGNGGTSTATVTVNVAAVNDAPVASNDIASTPVNTTLNNINVLANDSDVDGDPLTVTSAVLVTPAQGTVTINPDGTLRFVPAANVSGPVQINYTIRDPSGLTSTATLTVNVGNNTPPDSAGRSITSNEDTPVTLTTADFAFIDPDAGQTLANVRIDSLPAKGTLQLNGVKVTPGQVVSVADINAGKLVYTPAANDNGGNYTSFNFSVQDSAGAFDVAPNTVTFNITPVNDAPVANPDTVATPEDQPLTILPATLLGNDSDVDGDTLTITNVTAGPGGTVAIVNGNIVFTPTPDFNGPASFTYTVSDGKGGTATGTVNVSVTPVNDAPVGNPDTVTATEDTPVTIPVATLLGNDTDVDGDPLSITSVQNPVGGTVTLVGGNVVFTPAPNFNGPASFSYTVSDGQGGTSTVSVRVNVTPVNDPPVINPDSPGPVAEDTPVRGNVLTNDSDPDGDPLTVSGFTVGGVPGTFAPGQVATIPGVGTVVINVDGSYLFTPAQDYNGPVPPITYTAVDGKGGSGTGTLSLGPVTPVNDAPIATPDTFTTPVNTPARNIPVLGNDRDVDGDPLTVTSAKVDPSRGTVTVNPDGTLDFVPATGIFGVITITYTVSDGKGGVATGTLSLTVSPPNDLLPPAGEQVDYTPPPAPGFNNVAAPALHVLYSVNDARVEAELRSGLGLFAADSVTMAELANGLGADLSFAEGSGSDLMRGSHLGVQTSNALFVQHAVRHESLGNETGLFVQQSVRASQLESLARSLRVDSFNAAVPGVGTLFDPFAIGAPLPEVERTPAPADANAQKPAPQAERPAPRAAAERDVRTGQSDKPAAAKDAKSAAVQRRAADGFGEQLRRSASDFRPRVARTEAVAQAQAQAPTTVQR